MSRDPFPITPGAQAGITESMIQSLVHRFYGNVRLDPMLGPIFNAAIDNWDEHLDKLCQFWSSVTLMTGRYKGTPMKVHAKLPDISGAHFDRWLELFRQTANEVCPGAPAQVFIDRAERIAQSLEFGVATSRGLILQKGERLGSHPVQPPR